MELKVDYLTILVLLKWKQIILNGIESQVYQADLLRDIAMIILNGIERLFHMRKCPPSFPNSW